MPSTTMVSATPSAAGAMWGMRASTGGKLGGEAGAADGAGERAHEGYADLNGGEKALRVLRQKPRGAGAGDALALPAPRGGARRADTRASSLIEKTPLRAMRNRMTASSMAAVMGGGSGG